MRINVNLNEIHENVTPGWYPVRIVGSDLRTSQNKGTQYIAWTMEIVDPTSEFNGWNLFNNTPIEGRGAAMLKQFLRAADFEPEEDGGFSTEDVIGHELEVRVEHREYEGRVQDNVTSVRAI